MNLDAALDLLSKNPAAPLDVAELAFWLARDEYPALDVEAGLAELDAMAHEARAFVRGDFSARVTGLCRYLFHDMGFHGNVRAYYDPRNSYFNQVLERRTGIPISLAAVTMAVGSRAGLNIVGVGLPGHFVVKAEHAGQEILIDPFHGGRRLTNEDCENLVFQMTKLSVQVTSLQLQALPLGLMVQRMLSNLKGIYLGGKDFSRAVRVLQRLHQLNPYDPQVRRDLGACWMSLGKPGQAIDHLAAYVEGIPEAQDHQAVRQLLRQAKAQVALWN